MRLVPEGKKQTLMILTNLYRANLSFDWVIVENAIFVSWLKKNIFPGRSRATGPARGPQILNTTLQTSVIKMVLFELF